MHRTAHLPILLIVCVATSATLLPGCEEDNGDHGPHQEGQFSVLTYNVAGLPEALSGSHPEANMPQISPMLNDFDLVLAQEDFWYHEQLIADVTHPYQSVPWNDVPDMLDMGDGLNRFSYWPFGELTRTAWPDCNGELDCASDCLATKGFSVAEHEIAPGVFVEIYNLHMEAGGCPEDEVIRIDSIQQLIDTVASRSSGLPVIMAGDFNLHEEDAPDRELLDRLVLEAGFQDACWALSCGETNIDRIFLRDGGGVSFQVQSWTVPEQFVDADGEDLSDHEPVAATIAWERN